MLFLHAMKAQILQRSVILRYEGEYADLSALRLAGTLRILDRETSDARGEGDVSFCEEDITLSYREEESGMTVALKKEGDRLEIRRGGAALSFAVGCKTSFVYRTAYGSIPTEAIAEQITLQRKGRTALLTLVYTAVLGTMAQKNEMRFKITC